MNAGNTIGPSITVILPVYNGGEYLVKSVESVLNQELKNFEFLVLDDCSTDGSLNYLESIRDTRMNLYKNEQNKGLFYNLNFLIRKSRSPLIKLWSQDDVMYPICLAEIVNFHQRHPGIGFSYCSRDIIDEHGIIKPGNGIDHTPEVVRPLEHARIAFFTGSIAGNIANVCISKKALDEVGLFREDMKISGDFDMWVRLAKDHDTGFISAKLVQLRDHKGQLSRNESWYINHVKEDLQVYHNLLSYVPVEVRKKGKQELRQHKFVFYYTLMLKAFLKGKWKTGLEFARVLSEEDNIFLLGFSFIKAKLGITNNNKPGKRQGNN